MTTEDGRQLEIAQLRATKRDEAVVRFAGVMDRNTAETLKGLHLYVPRAALPEPEGGAFYHADLVGLIAEDASGTRLGTVRGVHNFGAGDVIEIEFIGGATSSFLSPMPLCPWWISPRGVLWSSCRAMRKIEPCGALRF